MVDVLNAVSNVSDGTSCLLYVQYQVPKTPANVISFKADRKHVAQMVAIELYARMIFSLVLSDWNGVSFCVHVAAVMLSPNKNIMICSVAGMIGKSTDCHIVQTALLKYNSKN